MPILKNRAAQPYRLRGILNTLPTCRSQPGGRIIKCQAALHDASNTSYRLHVLQSHINVVRLRQHGTISPEEDIKTSENQPLFPLANSGGLNPLVRGKIVFRDPSRPVPFFSVVVCFRVSFLRTFHLVQCNTRA